MEIDRETGELVGGRASSRFTLWVAFLVFATITLGSSVEVVSCRFLYIRFYTTEQMNMTYIQTTD